MTDDFELAAELAEYLAAHIVGAAVAWDFTAEDFQESPEIERIAEVADRLRAAGRDVPLPIREMLREAEAAGWRRVA
jgi:hypothetical protein